MTELPLPAVVSREDWLAANAAQIAREKAHTRARDALNAQRRRLPVCRIDKDYRFEGPEGPASLLDLFRGHRQLVLYHFMFGPGQEEGCDGCSMVVDNMGHPAHLEARDIQRVLVSRAPLARLRPFQARMGWREPWYSSAGSDFNVDFGLGPREPQAGQHQDGEMFGLSVFIRDDAGQVYQSYFTQFRGVEYLGSSFSYYDLVPWGRQEDWEDSPAAWPQGPRYSWWRHHDRYGQDAGCHVEGPKAP